MPREYGWTSTMRTPAHGCAPWSRATCCCCCAQPGRARARRTATAPPSASAADAVERARGQHAAAAACLRTAKRCNSATAQQRNSAPTCPAPCPALCPNLHRALHRALLHPAALTVFEAFPSKTCWHHLPRTPRAFPTPTHPS
eukprot:92033-Chlamydomonas_euryale.AAC.1